MSSAYRPGDKVISDDATGTIVEADAAGVTVDWGQENGGTQRYTWAEIEEYDFTLQQR